MSKTNFIISDYRQSKEELLDDLITEVEDRKTLLTKMAAIPYGGTRVIPLASYHIENNVDIGKVLYIGLCRGIELEEEQRFKKALESTSGKTVSYYQLYVADNTEDSDAVVIYVRYRHLNSSFN